MMDEEFVTYAQWEAYAKRIEKRNREGTRGDVYASGIARQAERFIIAHVDGGMLVKKGWRERMATVSKYGYSLEHDEILELCIAKFGTCPFGCVKNGAPNCWTNAVLNRECPPAKDYAAGDAGREAAR